jgi:hypothetical protein
VIRLIFLYALFMCNVPSDAYANASLWDVEGGDVIAELVLDGSFAMGALVEQREEYGGVIGQSFGGTVRGTFGLTNGVGLSVAIPYQSWKTTYQDVVLMQVDPALERGTITAGRLLGDDVERSGTGLADSTVTLSLWPSSWAEGSVVSSRLSAGFSLGNPDNSRWSHDQTSLGSSDGASTWTLGGTLWRTGGTLRPWIDANARLVSSYALTDEEDADVIEPPSNLSVRAGVRRKISRNSQVSWDFFTGFSTTSGSSVPSGSLLPSVLSLTEGLVVNISPTHSWSLGAGQEIDIWKKAAICWDTVVTYHAQRRLESTYEIYTSTRELSVASRLSLFWRAR